MRIHILGGPGSGKTSLARYVAAKFGIPRYELDQIGNKHGNRTADYIAEAFAISERPQWVAEGIYLIWTDPLLYRADYIVVLDIPWRLAALRIIRRHVRRSLRGTNPYPGFNGVKLLQFASRYYTETSSVLRTSGALDESGIDGDQPPHAGVLLERFEAHVQTVPFTSEFVSLYIEKYKDKLYIVKDKADIRRLIALIKRGEIKASHGQVQHQNQLE